MATFQLNATLLDRIKSVAQHPDDVMQLAFKRDDGSDDPANSEYYVCHFDDREAAAIAIVGSDGTGERQIEPRRHPTNPAWFMSSLRWTAVGPTTYCDGHLTYGRVKFDVEYAEPSREPA